MSDAWGKEEVEAGNPIISLFFAPNVFFFFSPAVSGGKEVDELQRCGQGHRRRSGCDVQNRVERGT